MVSLSNGRAPGHVGQGHEYRVAPTALARASSRFHSLMSRADILNGWFTGSRGAAMNASNVAKPVFWPQQIIHNNQNWCLQC